MAGAVEQKRHAVRKMKVGLPCRRRRAKMPDVEALTVPHKARPSSGSMSRMARSSSTAADMLLAVINEPERKRRWQPQMSQPGFGGALGRHGFTTALAILPRTRLNGYREVEARGNAKAVEMGTAKPQ
jgi:hypothetical protein